MRNEKINGLAGKSQIQYGRRRRSHKSRSSNTETAHKSALNASSAENLVLKLDKNSVRFAKCLDEKFSSIRERQTIKVFNSIFNVDNNSRHSRKDKAQCVEVRAATDERKASETKENDQSAKGAISRSDKPIPARPSNPLRFKTELCRAHEEGGHCRFGISCTFAHGQEELRSIARHHKYKTEQCRSYHSIGYCQYGTRCHFIHDSDDMATVVPFAKPGSQGLYECFGPSKNNLLESIGLNLKSPLDENVRGKSPGTLETADQYKGLFDSPKQPADNAALKSSLAYMELFLPSPPAKTSEKFMEISLSPQSIELDICKDLFSRTSMEILNNSPEKFSFPLAESPKYTTVFSQSSIREETSKFNKSLESSPKRSRLSLTNNIEEDAEYLLFHNSAHDWGRNFGMNPWRSVSPKGLSGLDANSSREAWWRALGSSPAPEASPAETPKKSNSTDPALQARPVIDNPFRNTETLSCAVAESVISEPPELTWDMRLPMIKEFYPKILS
ncbi:uncharacterized protein LOC135217776 [Macrobrachium nipponense]|uniref:uncharacterized protein LOC135217776 n=1 Tax=Macrobrachium nipponense TaxID=159736 RepID=UPI0030C8A2AA